MANVAQQFRALNAFIDGRSYAGVCEEFHPAPLRVMTDEYQAAGMDTPVLLDMGMEALMARLVINGYDGNILNQFGLQDADAANMEVRGALEDYDGSVIPVIFTMRGNVITMPFGRIRGRGEVPKMIIEMALSYYKIAIDGIDHVTIDVLNMIREIGGVDRLATLRAAIGVTG